MDAVLFYKNKENLYESVYKSENYKLFEELKNDNQFMTFSEKNKEYIDRNVELLLWKLNTSNEEFPKSLEFFLDPEAMEEEI